MNLTEVRQNLLEQLQARVADGIAEGMALRYCLDVGAERRVVDVAELVSPVPWSWNLCIAASRGAAPRAWEVLEFVGSPEQALHVVEVLRDLLRDEWQVGAGRLECAVQGDPGWNGHREALEESLALVTGGGDLRFRGAERAPQGRIRLNVFEQREDSHAETGARRLRIQLDPHEVFAYVLGFESECEIEPLSRVFDVAEELGLDLPLSDRSSWSAALRFWAHGMNLIELESSSAGGAEGAAAAATSEALRTVLAEIETEGRRWIESAESSGDRGEQALARWLDAARAIEDELCAVLLAMPETARPVEFLHAEETEPRDGDVLPRPRRSAREVPPEAELSRRSGELEANAGAHENEPALESDSEGAPEEHGEPAFAVDAKPEEVFGEERSPSAADLHLLPVSASAARQLEPTPFVGDDQDACEAKVVELFDAEGAPVARLDAGDSGWLAASRSCFFAYGAGVQVDRGLAVWGEGRGRIVDVCCVQDVVLHALQVDHGFLRAGGALDLVLDRRRRREVERQCTAAAAVASLLEQWVSGARDGKSARDARPSGDRIELLEIQAGVEGFRLSVRLPEPAVRAWDDPALWRDRLERELGEWSLDAWWIDPAGSAEDDRDRDALLLAVRNDARNEAGRGGPSKGRRVLSLGPLGWIRTDAIAVPNSAHVGLVLLATPERLYDDAWSVRGVAGRRAFELARTEVHLVESATGELSLAAREDAETRAGSPAAARASSTAAAASSIGAAASSIGAAASSIGAAACSPRQAVARAVAGAIDSHSTSR